MLSCCWIQPRHLPAKVAEIIPHSANRRQIRHGVLADVNEMWYHFREMSETSLAERKALILTDGKAGHENQSKAFARALGCGFDLLPVRFRSGPAKAASYLLDRVGAECAGLLSWPDEAETLAAKGYAAVIGAGSGTFYAAKTLARRLGVKCGVVLYPRGYRISSFDCILAPSFDRPAKAPNVVEIPANLVASDAAFYEAGRAAFLERHSPKRAAAAVIVGGPNKCSTLTVDWMRAELERVFSECSGMEMWVTTSRRTPPDVEAVIDSFPFDYRLIYSRDRFNPIPAFVTLAKKLYVTAESTGMLSEACTFGTAEVYALDNLNPGGHKFRRFVDALKRDGYLNGSRKIDMKEQFAAARRLMGL